METREHAHELSLLGGPLHRQGCRLGLVRGGTNTVPLGLVPGLVPWLMLLALALCEGLGRVLFSLEAISAHIRLLVVIPLLFACETFIDPRFGAFASGIVRSRVVPETECQALQSLVARLVRWKDAWLPEALLLLAAVLIALAAPDKNVGEYLSGLSGSSNPSAVSEATWTSHWYWAGCTTLFRFLLLRWFWRKLLLHRHQYHQHRHE